MPQRVSILTARRSYEFPPDAIRLTVLSLPDVQGLIAQTFSFQQFGIGRPVPTFGDVPNTLPPGLAFDIGWVDDPDISRFFVRFLHFEARRIVIDVAAPSEMIDRVYRRLREALEGISAPDGQLALGEPRETLEYSEISADFAFFPEAILHPGLSALWTQTLGGGQDGVVLTPTVYGVTQFAGDEYPGAVTAPDSRILQFSLRQGALPEQKTFFSGAPLPTDQHLQYLERLESVLA